MSQRHIPALVGIDWLLEHDADSDLVVVDATTHLPIPQDGPYTPESGYRSFCSEHIPSAVFADLLTDFADPTSQYAWTVPDSAQFAMAAGAIGIADQSKVVVYDQHDGFWATRFWWHLRLEGFDAVAVLDGGLPAWCAAGCPVTDVESKPLPRKFTAIRRPELMRSTEQVAAALNDPGTILVNVLNPATYRGEATTYPRPGHIPGSVNLPVARIRDPHTGRLRQVAELREMFADAGLLDESQTIVTYCGGGIGATGVAHALAVAGRSDVAVYDGSMTEWASDPELPLVLGDSPR